MKITISTLPLLLLTLITPSQTHPHPPRPRPFKILISAPLLPTSLNPSHLPTYLSTTSSLTTNPSLAAPAILRSSALYITNFTFPLAIPVGSISTRLQTPSDAIIANAIANGKNLTSTAWSINANGELEWKNDVWINPREGGTGKATFMVEMNPDLRVTASVGGGGAGDTVPVKLVPVWV